MGWGIKRAWIAFLMANWCIAIPARISTDSMFIIVIGLHLILSTVYPEFNAIFPDIPFIF
jgi:hypothetical protein